MNSIARTRKPDLGPIYRDDVAALDHDMLARLDEMVDELSVLIPRVEVLASLVRMSEVVR